MLNKSYLDLKLRLDFGPERTSAEEVTNWAGSNFDDNLMNSFNIFLLLMNLKNTNLKLKEQLENPH